jgi:hypothetical protein
LWVLGFWDKADKADKFALPQHTTVLGTGTRGARTQTVSLFKRLKMTHS